MISTDFEALIHLMTDPSIHLRMQSCGTALRHRFFASSPSSSVRSTGTPSNYSTPIRSKAGRTPTQTPTSTILSSQKKLAHESPRRTPKTGPAATAFSVYQDPESAPSPAASTRTGSPFAPRPLALANRASTVLSHAPATPPSKQTTPKPTTPVVSVPATAFIVEAHAAAVNSPPPPSRIPVRKVDVASPSVPAASHRRFVSSPLTSPIRTVGTRPRVVSQPLLSGFKPPVDVDLSAGDVAAAAPARSASLKAVKRKPAPTFSAEFESTVPVSSKGSRTAADGTEEEVEQLSTPPADPVVEQGRGPSPSPGAFLSPRRRTHS